MKIDTPVLKRLGPVPFWRGESRCLDSLEVIYKRAMNTADAMLGGGASSDDASSAQRNGSHKPRKEA
jgi:hypothetical protein